MTSESNNKNDDTDNKWIQWIKDGIDNEYINYHDYNEFQDMECIGVGGFGNVYRANWKSSDTVVALKSLTNGKDGMKEVVNEIKLMHRINFHENIIQFFGITSNPNDESSNYSFILEYADSGTLKNYLKKNFNKLDWNIKLQFAIQIAAAVSCIHQKDIIHNDLVNILVIYWFIKIRSN
uniref:Protein kinase domain-containing protein n=1 Tax=Rhizophagus irregularis (strain DAOM 181602 / DAOM 197198 / MUCL 43194) TaxID=747089 RepID=U9TS22_RHIID